MRLRPLGEGKSGGSQEALPAPGAPLCPPPAAAPPRSKILVVDDVVQARELMQAMLEPEGFEVVPAATGAEALRLAAGAPDLIVLDIHLPDIDGFEVCRRLKADPATAAIPVLYLTGSRRTTEDRVRALDDGADGYLTKPVVHDELIATVRALLRRRGSRRAEEATRVLAEVGRQLTGPAGPGAVARSITDAVRRLFRVRRAVLYEVDRAAGTLVPVGAAGDEGLADWLGRPLRIGESAAGRAALEGRPVACADVTASDFGLDDAVRHRLRAEGYGAVASVPLTAHGETLGVLSLADWRGRTFTDEELRLLAAFADQAALARENARLYQDARRRLEATDGLLAVARTLATSLDRRELARRAARELTRLLRADTSVFVEIDETSARAAVTAGYRVPPALRALAPRFALADLPRFFVEGADEAQPAVSEDVAADARLDHPVIRALPLAPRSLLYAPMVRHGRLTGALVSLWWTRQCRFTEDEVRLAAGVMRLAAMSLDNARLHEESERRRQEAEVMGDLVRTITASLDLDAVLRRVAAKARELCGADLARVALREPGEDACTVRCLVGAGQRPPSSLRIETGKGLGGLVLTTGRPARTPHYATDPRISKHYLREVLADGALAMLAVPIRIGGQVEGLLYVANQSARPFGDRDEAVLVRFAEQVGVAIDNARHHAEATARLTRMKRLAELSQLLIAAGDATTILESTAGAALDLLGGDVASIWLMDAAGGGLRMAAQTVRAGEPPLPAGEPVGQALVRRAVERSEPCCAPDLLEEPLPPGGDGIAVQRYVSQIAVPLPGADHARGVLTVLTVRRQRFTGEDVELLATLGAGAVSAVENECLAGTVQRAQAQLLQAQKMDAIGRLAGGLAHDFNNILTVINGRSQLMLRGLSADHPMHRPVEIIQDASRRAAALTHQLLAFSRQQVLRPRVLDLNAAVVRMAGLLERLIGEHIHLWLELTEARTLVKADPSQLEQVILNLVVNARDAMPDGGKLTVRTVRVEPPGGGPGSAGAQTVLEVRDTGCGMDERVRQRIFEPFFTTKPKGKGTGLGLSTVYGIVQQSGGSIAVESEPGLGATFRVCLPAAAEEVEPEAAAPTPAAGRGTTILVVEPDDVVRGLVAEIFETAGLGVIEARAGAEAFARAEQTNGRRIDLVVTSVPLPGVNGRLPTVTLDKPFTPDRLLDRVRQALAPEAR